jgi:putative ABC transport system permease protein
VSERHPTLFTLLGQSGAFGATFLVRHEGNAEATIAAIESRVREADASFDLAMVQPLEALYDAQLHEPRFQALLVGALGLLLGLLVATLGVYGVVAYAVAKRTNEIGIRMTLGAGAIRIAGLLGGWVLLLIAAGLSGGLLGSLWLTRYMRALLFGVEPTDPVAIGATAAILAATALAATLVPITRAVRVDPARTLRSE